MAGWTESSQSTQRGGTHGTAATKAGARRARARLGSARPSSPLRLSFTSLPRSPLPSASPPGHPLTGAVPCARTPVAVVVVAGQIDRPGRSLSTRAGAALRAPAPRLAGCAPCFLSRAVRAGGCRALWLAGPVPAGPSRDADGGKDRALRMSPRLCWLLLPFDRGGRRDAAGRCTHARTPPSSCRADCNRARAQNLPTLLKFYSKIHDSHHESQHHLISRQM